MEFITSDVTIVVNDFTREIKKIIDSNNNVIDINNESNAIHLQNLDMYKAYLNKINYFSNVYYNITKRCNLKCIYCYFEHNPSFVSIDDNEVILDNLEKLNVRSITLIGGEPFCHPYFTKILTSIFSRDFVNEVCIVTNGTLINSDNITYLKDPRVYLQISLDGIDEKTNSLTRGANVFDKVMSNITLLQKENIRFKVMKVITRQNIDNSVDYYDFYKGHGIDCGFFMVKKVPDCDKPQMKQIVQLLNAIYDRTKDVYEVFDVVKFADNMMFSNTGFPIMHCGAGINALSINPDGNVYPCVKRSEHDDLITNILCDCSVDDILQNKERIYKEELVYNKAQCNTCKIKYFCGGGCRAEENKNSICRYNCDYFMLAFNFYMEHLKDRIKISVDN